MPREGDPRVSLRLDPVEYEVLRAAAERSNVAVGALVRECVRRAASQVAADASAGRVSLRRRSAAVPVPASAAPSDAVTPRPKREIFPQVIPPGVTTARELAMARQRRLNEGKGSGP